MEVHVPDTHLMGGIRKYFICLCKPFFNGPMKQLDLVKKDEYACIHLQYLTNIDRQLKSKLQDYIDRVFINRHVKLLKMITEKKKELKS